MNGRAVFQCGLDDKLTNKQIEAIYADWVKDIKDHEYKKWENDISTSEIREAIEVA